LVEAALHIVPISVTMKDKIEELRGWAKTRARMAGEPFDTEVERIRNVAGLEV
jgi:hypothetical protein